MKHDGHGRLRTPLALPAGIGEEPSSARLPPPAAAALVDEPREVLAGAAPPAAAVLARVQRPDLSIQRRSRHRARQRSGGRRRQLFGEHPRESTVDVELRQDVVAVAPHRLPESHPRAAHVARLCNELGQITIVALVSPFAADRQAARQIVGRERFHLLYLSAPLEACGARDEEGLYARARAGEIERFTGLTAPYEQPAAPELSLPTDQLSVQDTVARVVEYLEGRSAISE